MNFVVNNGPWIACTKRVRASDKQFCLVVNISADCSGKQASKMKKTTLALFVVSLRAESLAEEDEADLEDFEKTMLDMEKKDEEQINEEFNKKDPGFGAALRLIPGLIRATRGVRVRGVRVRPTRVRRTRFHRTRVRRVRIQVRVPPRCAERRRRSWDPSRRRGCASKKR
eukprot:gene6000-6698_t